MVGSFSLLLFSAQAVTSSEMLLYSKPHLWYDAYGFTLLDKENSFSCLQMVHMHCEVLHCEVHRCSNYAADRSAQ